MIAVGAVVGAAVETERGGEIGRTHQSRAACIIEDTPSEVVMIISRPHILRMVEAMGGGVTTEGRGETGRDFW